MATQSDCSSCKGIPRCRYGRSSNDRKQSPSLSLSPSRFFFFGSSFDYRVIELHIIPQTHTHITYCSMLCCVLLFFLVSFVTKYFYTYSVRFCFFVFSFSIFVPPCYSIARQAKNAFDFMNSKSMMKKPHEIQLERRIEHEKQKKKLEFVKLQVYVIESAFYSCIIHI